jgi:hypothetical protein
LWSTGESDGLHVSSWVVARRSVVGGTRGKEVGSESVSMRGLGGRIGWMWSLGAEGVLNHSAMLLRTWKVKY